MSVLVFGTVNVPQADIVEATVHLGCSKEVSSFDILIQNWNGKYSPNGTYPIVIGAIGGMGLCRSPNDPANSAVISLRVEGVKYESDPVENYVRVTGRCWGERLFRRVITKTFEGWKGEAIVKHLLDYFTSLSHVRNTVELVEDTDTTYTKLAYVDAPLWDIIKYVAESSDKDGVIGFDFRIAPDGKFEFFPKNSKTSSVSLSEKIESGEFRKDISRVRNRIKVFGEASKSIPLDKDGLTEILEPSEGVWSATWPGGQSGVVAQDCTFSARGLCCIKCHVDGLPFGAITFTFNDGYEVDCNLFPFSYFFAFIGDKYSGAGTVTLRDVDGHTALKNYNINADEKWHGNQLDVGAANSDNWDTIQDGFDWTKIKKFGILRYFPLGTNGFPVNGWDDFWVDGLYFGGRRYSSTKEDGASQDAYGLREYVETDEELWSDNECDMRARGLLAYLKDPAEYLTVKSTLIDYGTSPILPGDKIHVELPNENVDSDFRVESAEYFVDSATQTLEVTLELGKEPPQIADYLYGLRTFTVNVEKLARTKSGSRGGSSGGGGGGGTVFPAQTAVLEISELLAIDNLQVFKDTGNVLVYEDGHTTVTNVATPTGNFINVFATVISPLDHVTVLSDPMLVIDQTLLVEKDIQAFGSLNSASDPYKGFGGGAVMLGHGFEDSNDPPRINMTADGFHELAITAGSSLVEGVWSQANLDAVLADVRLRVLNSKVAVGTAPITAVSTTKCDNLNADRLDDHHASDFLGVDVYGYVTLTGIHFGEGWGDFYRGAIGNDNVIVLSGLGLVLWGYMNAKSISLNPPEGIPALGSDSGVLVCTNINADLLDGHHADDFLTEVGVLALSNMPQGGAGDSGKVLASQGLGNWPQYLNINSLISDINADWITSGGYTANVAVAKVGGGTRTLHFTNSKYTGYTDS